MKEKILRILRESGDYVSGQKLCQELGVSRTAVWKNIRSLQDDGYDIEAVTRKGYRIVGCPDTIAAQEVASILETKRMGKKICYFETIDSSNQYAKRIAEQGAEDGTLVIADEQTAGKGRSGRHWVTPKGSAIAFTVLLRPNLRPDRISMVTLVMGMAVAEAVRSLCGLSTSIKWPNDVVIGGKKICGILTEMNAEIERVNYIVIGTGINVNMTGFPEEIAQTATSIRLELEKAAGRLPEAQAVCDAPGNERSGAVQPDQGIREEAGREFSGAAVPDPAAAGEEDLRVNRARILAEVMKYFEKYYEIFEASGDLSGLRDEYNRMCANVNTRVRVLDPKGEYEGVSAGIDDRGELIVKKNDGEVSRVYAGEVSVRGIYGYV